jgi:tetratricopeptide (TPR) repeat protein
VKHLIRFALIAGVLAATLCAAQRPPVKVKTRQQAIQLEQQGKLAEAELAWRALARSEPSNAEPWAHLGLLEAHQEHYKEAVEFYRKALKLGPPLTSVRLNLALALFKQGDLKQAVKELEPLRAANPDNQQVVTLLGMAHYGLAEYAQAAPYLKTAAEHDTTNLPLRLALAHSYLWSGQSDKVMDVYHEILVLDPNSAEADMIAGEALTEMKDRDGAIKMFRAAVQANSKAANVHFSLAYLLWIQKQYADAAVEFQAELANDPNHVQSLLYLADSQIQLSHLDLAQPLLERVVKLAPSIPLGHLDLGIVYAESGRNEEAVRELTQAEKKMPEGGEVTTDMVTVHWRLGRLYRAMGRKDEAKAEFDKASQLNKKADTELHNKLANARERPHDAAPVVQQGQPEAPQKPASIVP